MSFTKECLLPLLSQAMGTQHVDRQVVQRLDTLIRNHRVADALRIREPLEVGIKGKAFDPGAGFDAEADPAAAAAAMDMILTVLKQHTIYLLTQKSEYDLFCSGQTPVPGSCHIFTYLPSSAENRSLTSV